MTDDDSNSNSNSATESTDSPSTANAASGDTEVSLDGDQYLGLQNTLLERASLAASMGQSWGHLDDRDYFDTLGYPQNAELDVDDFYALFDRGGPAETIVSAPAGATWNEVPEVSDTEDSEDSTSEFEGDVETLFDEHKTLHYLDRADTLQRIGQYGILLIGFNDGGDLDEEVNRNALKGNVEDDILYFQPFSEKQIEDFEREDDHTSERFGKPKTYDVNFGEDHPEGSSTVHHSRVLHIAEGALEDETKGRSALRAVFNLLQDLLYKVIGGSAEMFWRGADRKVVANLDSEAAGPIQDEDDLQVQVEELVNDLRSVVYSRGLDLETIDGDDFDPTGLKDAILELIAGQTRIPKRKLLGTERGDLASSQDEAAFVGLIEERRRKFAEPQILRPLLDMLREYGIISDPNDGSYSVEWPDLFELTELEEAERKQREAKALKDASSTGDPAELATVEERRKKIFDWSPERGSEAESSATGLPGESPGEGPPDQGDPEGEDLDESDPEVGDWFEEEFEDIDPEPEPVEAGGD